MREGCVLVAIWTDPEVQACAIKWPCESSTISGKIRVTAELKAVIRHSARAIDDCGLKIQIKAYPTSDTVNHGVVARVFHPEEAFILNKAFDMQMYYGAL